MSPAARRSDVRSKWLRPERPIGILRSHGRSPTSEVRDHGRSRRRPSPVESMLTRSPSTTPPAAPAVRWCPARPAPRTSPSTCRPSAPCRLAVILASSASSQRRRRSLRMRFSSTVGRLVARGPPGARQLGLGRHQPALDGRLEHRGAVRASASRCTRFESRDRGVEASEVRVESLDDASCSGQGRTAGTV